ncbi:MAG: hypothetical protein IJT96_06000 [Lachnospiraceae bacterium]|nr:hypothetical protein [Lachnospiraceae bacterium]
MIRKLRSLLNIHIGCAALVISIALLSGCGAEGVDISDEDVKRVADYSSDIVSQHNDKSDSRLVDINKVKRKYREQLDLEIKRQNFRAMEQAALNAEQQSSDGSGDGSGEGSGEEYVEPEMTLAEAIGVSGFDIYYTDYEVSRSYPTSGSVSADDVYMGMTAAQGDTLLIMHFNISNTEGLDKECDIIDMRPTFRVKINGENHTVQQTILPDDLSKYEGTVPAYSSADAVLIAEVQESVASDIESLSLIVRSADSRPEYKLE